MAQAKKKTATRTTKRTQACKRTGSKGGIRYERYQKGQKSNLFFVVSMSFLAATLLFANLLMMVA